MKTGVETLIIQDTVGDLLTAQDLGTRAELMAQVAEMSDNELRAELFRPLVERPAAVIGQEVMELYRHSQGRVLTSRIGREEIGTRTADMTDLDTRYSIAGIDSDTPKIAIRTFLRGQVESPFMVMIRDQDVTVRQRDIRFGSHRETSVEERDNVLSALAASMIWAVAETNARRHNGTQQQHDLHAKRLTMADVRKDRGLQPF